jgi:hypothetical protein
MKNAIKLAPSDLTFLFNDCKRCFYLKVMKNIRRPSTPMAAIFGAIDRAMTGHYHGLPSSEISRDLPAGTIDTVSITVKSCEWILEGHRRPFFITGRTDALIAFDEGGFCVPDFKTSVPKQSNVEFYARQLRAYAFALENPAPGAHFLSPIERLGLVCFEPSFYGPVNNDGDGPVNNDGAEGEYSLLGKTTWMEIPRDRDGFMDFMGRVMTILEAEEMPAADSKCEYCRLREAAKEKEAA